MAKFIAPVATPIESKPSESIQLEFPNLKNIISSEESIVENQIYKPKESHDKLYFPNDNKSPPLDKFNKVLTELLRMLREQK